MTIRIGLGLGVGRLVEGGTDLAEVVDALEALDFDSLWVSEVVGSHAPDPVAALGFAAARTSRLKFGTSVLVAPGRSPAHLAKQMTTVDRLSGGRFFPVLGLGTPDPDALAALGVRRSDRGAMVDEMIPLLRRIWAEDEVTHSGHFYSLERFRPHVHPVRGTLPIWLGGRSTIELRRIGRLADGWLASFATPAEVALSIPIINEAASAAYRTIDDDHYGVLLLYSLGPLSPASEEFIRWRRPDIRPGNLVPTTPEALHDLLVSFVAAGASKFILVPVERPQSWMQELCDLASIVRSVAVTDRACVAVDRRQP